jgi:uncharacterized protein (DUF1015 family)
MAEARPFRGLRFNPTLADPALNIAPPYDVISAAEQRALYERSDTNIVRIEYGEQRASDTASDSRYTRAAADLAAWRANDVLQTDAAPAIYAYQQEFAWDGRTYTRLAHFAAVRLEEWDKGIVKPHEHTLANPKADRMELLRATRTQVSPVYSLFRPRDGGAAPPAIDDGERIIDCEADGQRHVLSAITAQAAIEAFRALIAESDVYIADGHHRYETALAYRDEARAQASHWTGDEPENFVLMALTAADDPGLLVLSTHRLVKAAAPDNALQQLRERFDVERIDPGDAAGRLSDARNGTVFVGIGLEPGATHVLTLRDRAGVESTMPAEQPAAWKRLDVSVLQYGVLRAVFGIDDAMLTAGALAYTQDAGQARAAVERGEANVAFLLNATPVDQVLAVADAGRRMPQKSTYFQPKLPTGLVMRALDEGA